MISKINYSVIFAILMAGCVTDPDFERHNKNDPGAEVFKPDAPKNQEREITAEKHVILKWEDITEFEDGFLVEKKLRDDTDHVFVVIDTLSANVRSYTDTSRELTASTVYRVTPFVFNDSGGISENSKNYTTIHLNLRKLGGLLLFNRKDSVGIEWENSLEYFDALTFGYKEIKDEGELEEIVWVDTLSIKDMPLAVLNDSRRYDIEKPTNAFQYDMVVAAHLLDPGNDHSMFSITSRRITINKPTIENWVFEDEETLLVEWSSVVPDVETYEVYRGKMVARLSGDVNTYRFKGPVGNGLGFGIRGVKNGLFSNAAKDWANLQIKNLENFILRGQGNSIHITWDIPDNPYQPYTRFIIERSVGGSGNFEVYAELPPTAVEFTDNQVSQTEIYYYRIKSASSNYPVYSGVRYVPRLSLQSRVQRAAEVTYLSMSEDKQEIGAIENLDRQRAYLTELSGNERIISEPDFELSRVTFSRDNRHILLHGDSAGVAYTNIYDRQTLERKFQVERENSSEPVLLIPDTDKLLQSDFTGDNMYDLRIVDLNTGEILVSNPGIVGDPPLRLFYDIQKDQVITTNRNGIKFWDTGNLSLIRSSNLEHYGDNAVSFDDNQDVMYMKYSRRIYQHDLNANALTRVCCGSDDVIRFTYLKSPPLFAYTKNWSSDIYLYDPSTGLSFKEIEDGRINMFKMHDWSENNQLILQNSGSGTTFHDIVSKWSVIRYRKYWY